MLSILLMRCICGNASIVHGILSVRESWTPCLTRQRARQSLRFQCELIPTIILVILSWVHLERKRMTCRLLKRRLQRRRATSTDHKSRLKKPNPREQASSMEVESFCFEKNLFFVCDNVCEARLHSSINVGKPCLHSYLAISSKKSMFPFLYQDLERGLWLRASPSLQFQTQKLCRSMATQYSQKIGIHTRVGQVLWRSRYAYFGHGRKADTIIISGSPTQCLRHKWWK